MNLNITLFSKNILLTLLCATLFHGCNKDCISTPLSNHINFNNLQIGQVSKYLQIYGDNYTNGSDYNFKYVHDDTLLWTIVAKDDRGWLIEERLSPGSASLHHVPNPNVIFPDSIFTFYAQKTNDSIHFVHKNQASTLFFSRILMNIKSLSLNTITEPVAEIEGWHVSLKSCNNYCYAVDAESGILGRRYFDLNILLDYRPMTYDGNGFIYNYNKFDGIVRYLNIASWTSNAYGWDLLPN